MEKNAVTLIKIDNYAVIEIKFLVLTIMPLSLNQPTNYTYVVSMI